jgi:predicted TIM-barrel fold metal-dependent hydrolase
MIIDSHAYCFTAPDTPAGHPSAEAHLALWQVQTALHHQPAFRTRDRQRGDSRRLLAPAPEDPLRLAAGMNFRVDSVLNRLTWTVDGEDYAKQQFPPNVVAFSAGALVAEMDHADVDWALLHTDATLSRDLAFLGECVRAFPDRLRAMALVDEDVIPRDPDRAIRQLDEALRGHGLHAIKIIPEYAYRAGVSGSFNDGAWTPFWEAAVRYGVPFFFTLGPRPGALDPRAGFLAELMELRRWRERYPEARVSVTHGYPWRDFLEGDRFVLPPGLWEPLRGAAIHLEVGFPFRIGDRFDYPYRECRPVLEAMRREVGAEWLLWGTDMPFQNRFCTYRQSRTYLERHARDLFSPSEMAALMGGNAARLLRLAR